MYSKALSNMTRRPQTASKALTTTRKATMSTSAQPKYAPWQQRRILLTGCQGQIGVPLVHALCDEVGAENVIASDLSEQRFDFPCEYQQLDVTDEDGYREIVEETGSNYIVHLAGILSALGEKKPDLAVDVNVLGVINALRAAKDFNCRIFVPSSIAAFGGDHFPKD